jgi:DNA-directed RNA polymerase specialized sigma subunit
VAVPERVLLDRQYLYRRQTELADRLGREPSDQELADDTGLPLKRITYVRTYRPPVASGALRSWDDDGGGALYEPGVAEGPADRRVWEEFVYASLGPRDQLILERSLGLHGRARASNQEIAALLGVTPAAVSQRRRRIQEALDSRSVLGVL